MTSTSESKLPKWLYLSRFDRLIVATILALIVAIAVILIHGNQTSLQVNYFSWAGKKIGVQDRDFTLMFNRPVKRSSVGENLVVNPTLDGKISWTGNKLIYTLTELPIYGTKYEVQLQGASQRDSQQLIKPFIGTFYSHDRAFAYIGVDKNERGKLILCNIIQGANNVTELQKTILTPADLIATNFEIYAEGNKILFSAFEPINNSREVPKQQLYTVTTGLNFSLNGQNTPSGRIERILEAGKYYNLKFDMSDNGKTIVVQRVNEDNPGDAGLWVITEMGESRPLGIRGDNFLVSPDGQTVIVSQASGVAIIPLATEAGSPQFLPTYEKILGFSKDGQQKLVVKLNTDTSRSLFLINDKGEAKPLFRTANPLIACQFEPREEKTLYCLKTELVQGEDQKITEEPFLSIIDLETAQDLPILTLPNYRNVQMSMSPDGVALLFDQLVTTPFGVSNDLVTEEGFAIADGRLWLLPLPEIVDPNTPPKILPEELNAGFKPRWLP